MGEPYKFTHDGIEVQFHRGTVGTGMEARRIVRKLLSAYGYTDGNIAPDDFYDNADEYASAMARCKSTAEWWVSSNMPEEDVKRRFEIFLDQDEELYIAFRVANHATSQRQKKEAITTT